MFSSLHRRILVHRFGKARSEARRAKVGGPKDRERGEVLGAYGVASPIPQLGGLGSAVSSAAGSGAEPLPPKGFCAF